MLYQERAMSFRQTSECNEKHFTYYAAGLGLEPRYSPPEGDVLPLDDPAAQCTNTGTFTHVVPSECSLYGLYTIRRSGKKVPKTPCGAFAIYHIRQCPARYSSGRASLFATGLCKDVPHLSHTEAPFFQFTCLLERVNDLGTHIDASSLHI
jgi:hypothetical protein